MGLRPCPTEGSGEPVNVYTEVFSIEVKGPFRLDYTVWALRRKSENIVDRWDGHVYRRVLLVGEQPLEVAVFQEGGARSPKLKVQVTSVQQSRIPRGEVVATLGKALGLQVDLRGFYRLARGDETLKSLAHQFRGLKPPRFPSLFETLVNAIACQQLTLTVGIRLLNRLVEACGMPFQGPHGLAYAFPRPEDLARLSQERLVALGFSRQKSRYLLELAHAVMDGRVDLEGLAGGDDQEVLAYLFRLRGVGRWSAEYALLRGLGRLHIFPGDDVGARKSLQRWLGSGTPLDYEGVQRVLRRWHPYEGLVYFHLLLAHLASTGNLSSPTGKGS